MTAPASRARLAAVLAAALVATLLAPLAARVGAPAEAVEPVPEYPKAELQLADRPPPMSFLGAGEGGLSYVTESDVAMAVDSYGFDPARTDDTDGFVSDLDYGASPDLGSDVLALDVVEPLGPGSAVALVVHRDGSGPWSAEVVGEQSTGLDRTVAEWSFGASEPSDTSVPGDPVGAVLLKDPGTATLLAVFATSAGLYEYQLSAVGGDPFLFASTEVGEDWLEYTPVAIEHDDGFQFDGLVEPPPAEESGRFMVATAERSDDGTRDELRELVVVDGAVGLLGQDIGLVPVVQDAVGDDTVTWSRFDDPTLRYSANGTGDSSFYSVGLQAGDTWWLFSGLSSVLPLTLGGSYPCNEGYTGRRGFDFAQPRLYVAGGGIGEASPILAVCTANAGVDGLAVDATMDAVEGGLRQVERIIPPDDDLPVDARYFTDPQAHVSLPCAELLRSQGITSWTHPDATCDEPGNGGLDRLMGVTVLSGVQSGQGGGESRAEVERTRVVSVSPFGANPYDDAEPPAPWDQHWYVDLPSAGGVTRSMTPLPGTPVQLTVRIQDESCVVGGPGFCRPDVVTGDPIPMALLTAPPQVEGAGQEPLGPPEFAQSSSNSSGQTDLTAARVGAIAGFDYTAPLFGAEFEVEYTREVEETVTTTTTTTQSESFGGLTDQDVLVYNAATMWSIPATVLGSSTGVGIGSTTDLLQPRSNVLTSASVDFVRATYPETFGPGSRLGAGLFEAQQHEPGDPGSYLRYGTSGGGVDAYCEGNIDGTEPIDVPGETGVAPNPFVNDPVPPRPDTSVLVSDEHLVLAGTGNAEGASVELTEEAEQSYLQTHSIDASVTGTAFGVKAGVTGGGTVGGGWNYSVSTGTAFSGSVGHIPYPELEDETYSWRMFLCKRDIGSRGGLGKLPIWVLGYTVDDYRGDGSFALGPVTADAPRGDVIVPVTDPSLTWTQSQGVVERFDWELEQVDGTDDRSGTVTYDGLDDGRDPGTVTVDVGADLEPGATYRWRVVTTDVFGNQVQSDHVFFATDAGPSAPTAAFTWSPEAPVVGEPVTFTADEVGDGTTFAWDLAGAPAQGREVTHTFDEAGLLAVTLSVANAGGEDERTRAVPVRATADDDLFTGTEDQRLTVDAPGVLANDAGATRAVLDGDTSAGELRLQADGAFTYLPDEDACGPDGFGYVASGGGLDGERGAVALDVACTNDAPVARPDVLAGVEDQALHVDAPGLLANDTDVDEPSDGVDAGVLTARPVGQPDHGELTLAPTGGLTYTPELDFCGADRFTYVASDGVAESEPVAVDLEVACVNDAPDGGGPVTIRTLEDTPVDGVLPGSDVDGDTLTYELLAAPTRGELDLAPDGSFTYTPDPDVCGSDGFRYRTGDGEAVSREVLATVEVTCVDDLPPEETLDETPVDPDEPVAVDLAPDTTEVVVTTVTDSPLVEVAVDGSSIVLAARDGECGQDVLEATLEGPDGERVVVTVPVTVPCQDGRSPSADLRVLGGERAVADTVLDRVDERVDRGTRRLAGEDRYATSAETALDGWPEGADTVLLATGRAFPDGLAAGAAAVQYDAPVLLTDPAVLQGPTESALRRLDPDRVVLLGGEQAIAGRVADQVADRLDVDVERWGGADRYATAADVAARAWPDGADEVYVAVGTAFPDALAGSAAAGTRGAPVLLTRPEELPEVTVAALEALRPGRVVLLGGTAAAGEQVADAISRATGISPDRVAGVDRYATAAAVARDAWPDGARSSYLATGRVFADALSGAAAAGRREVPVLLVGPTVLPESTMRTLDRLLE